MHLEKPVEVASEGPHQHSQGIQFDPPRPMNPHLPHTVIRDPSELGHLIVGQAGVPVADLGARELAHGVRDTLCGTAWDESMSGHEVIEGQLHRPPEPLSPVSLTGALDHPPSLRIVRLSIPLLLPILPPIYIKQRFHSVAVNLFLTWHLNPRMLTSIVTDSNTTPRRRNCFRENRVTCDRPSDPRIPVIVRMVRKSLYNSGICAVVTGSMPTIGHRRARNTAVPTRFHAKKNRARRHHPPARSTAILEVAHSKDFKRGMYGH